MKQGLQRHIATIHEKRKDFECDLCEKAFGRKDVLKAHKDLNHKPSKTEINTEN